MIKILLSLFLVLSISSAQLDFQLNDVKTLNYALVLEHLEAAFYNLGMSTFNASDFAAANYSYAYFGLIRDHENSHVSILTSAIIARGGTPVPDCTYNFSFGNNITAFALIAYTLENTGVTAYDGAIDTISELALIQAAATIATVEARHAAYLGYITQQYAPNTVFPFGAFDTARTPAEIIAAVGMTQFITGCDIPFTNPSILPVNATFAANLNITNPSAASANDIKALQYQLFTQRFDSIFYNLAVHTFNRTDFINAGYQSGDFDFVNMVSQHEDSYVNYLVNTLTGLNVTPVPACVYNFTLTSVTQFLTMARDFEATSVAGYDGAINAITSLEYKMTAATIGTVEGRHAAFFANLIGSIPFPAVTEPTLTPEEVIARLMPYITSCPPAADTSVFLPIVAANFSVAAQIGAFNGTSSNSSATTGNNAVATSGSQPMTTGASGSMTTDASGSMTTGASGSMTTGATGSMMTTGGSMMMTTGASMMSTTSRTSAAVSTTSTSGSLTVSYSVVLVLASVLALFAL